MAKILAKRKLAPEIYFFEVAAPLVAAKAQPGHFVIVRADQTGERIPLTIVDYDREGGTIDLVVQRVGASTQELASLAVGDSFLDLLGPLGEPVEIEKIGTVVCVAGGLGVAPVYPKAKYLKEAGNEVINIVGARTAEMVIMKEEMSEVADEIYFSTDDGSLGHEGFVTEVLDSLLAEGKEVDEVIAVGPAIMMKGVAEVTAKYDVDTIVSLNPIMVDGTGMCGGCRVTVGEETKFACVEGPAFDGHLVDFDELMRRQGHYQSKEEKAEHKCKLEKEVE
ncbi:sulfide/dihydroorotate dehydrogenase-like FAD/NAD-binding protein [Fuchsiella alkaliacetigena]|uniref:sulfide/dihydroorotate dehydrogenase-like FAD/NAD-binding protein n=1 Tax=Fuchsiella alkaliacetigena TaxID=957042 RepID=UPI00200A1177|nr:sulfide/dihydroorotate dehydrogenase-like FAD/NAD-binding protein [Fuchsiella alkaliacetigena]MCK8824993.1 sulfide/dihydroorotate dehydrogenase-like FAD/NAD-binding protein [Fuchsiella alkaliacetigena]